LLAGSAGPADGVKAVEMTDAVHVVGPPRWSETATTPSDPDIVLEVVDATCVPSETPAVGALMESVPDVSVNDAGVEADAGRAIPMVIAAIVATRRTIFRTIETPHLVSRAAPLRNCLSCLSNFESDLDLTDVQIIQVFINGYLSTSNCITVNFYR
jgi:hypothetical protein